MVMPCTLEKVLRVGKGSRGANRTGAHYSARPRTKSGFRYTFWPRNKTKTNLVSIKVWKRVSTRYIRGQKSPKASVGQKKSVSKRTHPCACTWTAVRKQKCGHPHGWLLISPFLTLDAWKYRLRAETDGDAPDEVNFHSKVKKKIHWRNDVDRSLTMEHF